MSVFTDRQWAKAARQARARAEAVREPIRRIVREARERSLEDVQFASPIAWKLAFDSELNWPDFADVAPSSTRGYTVDDVRRIVSRIEAERGPEVEEETDGR